MKENKSRDSIVEVNGLSHSYDSKPVLENISFRISKGDFVAVLGRNGAGKTTLVKILLGLVPLQKGTVKILGSNPGSKGLRIGYVPQKPMIEKSFPGTVREILVASGADPSQDLNLPGIHELLDKRFSSLSGGQQQKVLIALALGSSPELLILDEPTVGVDMLSQSDFYSLLKSINSEKNTTIMIITHDVGVVSKHVKSVLCINRSTCCHGAPYEVRKLLSKVYGEDFGVFHHHHDD